MLPVEYENVINTLWQMYEVVKTREGGKIHKGMGNDVSKA